MNKAAMFIFMYVFWWTYALFLFDIYLGMGLLGHKVDVCLTSVDSAKQISKVVYQSIYMTICSIWELQLFHIFPLPTLGFNFGFGFHFSHSGGCAEGSHCDFDFDFPGE